MTCTDTCVRPSPAQAHCAAAGCHHTFGSVRGFDRHRRAGACLDPAMISGQHLTEAGIWRFDGGQQRAHAHAARPSVPESAETGSVVPQGWPRAPEGR
jgi:hypothetical protein